MEKFGMLQDRLLCPEGSERELFASPFAGVVLPCCPKQKTLQLGHTLFIRRFSPCCSPRCRSLGLDPPVRASRIRLQKGVANAKQCARNG